MAATQDGPSIPNPRLSALPDEAEIGAPSAGARAVAAIGAVVLGVVLDAALFWFLADVIGQIDVSARQALAAGIGLVIGFGVVQGITRTP